MIPELEAGWIVSAEVLLLPVGITRGHAMADGALQSLVGELLHADRGTGRHRRDLVVLVECVVVELQSRRVARQPIVLTQWAGKIIGEGDDHGGAS